MTSHQFKKFLMTIDIWAKERDKIFVHNTQNNNI